MVVEMLGRGGGVKVVMILRRRMERNRVESAVGGICNIPDVTIDGGVFGSAKGYVGNGIAHHIMLYLPVALLVIFAPQYPPQYQILLGNPPQPPAKRSTPPPSSTNSPQ